MSVWILLVAWHLANPRGAALRWPIRDGELGPALGHISCAQQNRASQGRDDPLSNGPISLSVKGAEALTHFLFVYLSKSKPWTWGYYQPLTRLYKIGIPPNNRWIGPIYRSPLVFVTIKPLGELGEPIAFDDYMDSGFLL